MITGWDEPIIRDFILERWKEDGIIPTENQIQKAHDWYEDGITPIEEVEDPIVRKMINSIGSAEGVRPPYYPGGINI